MPDRIDAFAHVLPRQFYERLNEVHPSTELQALGDATRFWDVTHRLDILDEYGIDKQVVTLARPPIWRGLDSEEAFSLTRVANDAVADYADGHDRLIPVGTLPYLSGAYLDEFDRCLDDLGMVGIQIFSNLDGAPIDTAEEFYTKAERTNTPIWLHPQLHDWHKWDEEYMLHKILGWPFDTSLALARLVFNGVIDSHPNLQIIPHHMGAMIPHFSARLTMFHQMLVEHRDVYPYPVTELDEPVEHYFRQFYGDSCRCNSPEILEDGCAFFGEDNLLFATDYPFGPDKGRGFLAEEVRGVEEMDVSEDVREKIFGGNVRSLIDR